MSSSDSNTGKTTPNGHRRTRTDARSLKFGLVTSISRLKYAPAKAQSAFIARLLTMFRRQRLVPYRTSRNHPTLKASVFSTISCKISRRWSSPSSTSTSRYQSHSTCKVHAHVPTDQAHLKQLCGVLGTFMICFSRPSGSDGRRAWRGCMRAARCLASRVPLCRV